MNELAWGLYTKNWCQLFLLFVIFSRFDNSEWVYTDIPLCWLAFLSLFVVRYSDWPVTVVLTFKKQYSFHNAGSATWNSTACLFLHLNQFVQHFFGCIKCGIILSVCCITVTSMFPKKLRIHQENEFTELHHISPSVCLLTCTLVATAGFG